MYSIILTLRIYNDTLKLIKKQGGKMKSDINKKSQFNFINRSTSAIADGKKELDEILSRHIPSEDYLHVAVLQLQLLKLENEIIREYTIIEKLTESFLTDTSDSSYNVLMSTEREFSETYNVIDYYRRYLNTINKSQTENKHVEVYSVKKASKTKHIIEDELKNDSQKFESWIHTSEEIQKFNRIQGELYLLKNLSEKHELLKKNNASTTDLKEILEELHKDIDVLSKTKEQTGAVLLMMLPECNYII